MILQLLAIVGTLVGFACITLSVASGLYYASEIIDDNIEFTRRFLSRTLKVLALIISLLWLFDGFPFWQSLLTLVSYYVYNLNLRTFPNVNLTGPIFIATCALALVNHYVWFRYFNNPYVPPIDQRLDPNFKMPHYPTFAEIASFFGICVWLVPFSLFISISANDSSLPMSATDLHSESTADREVKKSVNLVRYLITTLLAKINHTLRSLGINFKVGGSNDSSDPNQIYT